MSAFSQELEQAETTKHGWALVVLNPVAGRSSAEEVRTILEETFGAHNLQYEVIETTLEMQIASEVEAALKRGCNMVVACGGDGTVSEVAHCLARSTVTLGILPGGTANVLAVELGIPQDMRQAAALLAGDHAVRELDLMQASGRYWVLQIGVGIDSLMIKETARESKRRFGRLAYMVTLVQQTIGHQSRRYTMVVDGERMRPRAWEVLIANAGTLGMRPFTWGPNIAPDDGALDLVILKVRRPLDYFKLAWQMLSGRHQRGSNASYIRVHKQVVIAADHPLPVQADGEVIGETPITISLVPQALRVAVPNQVQPQPKAQKEEPMTDPQVVQQTREALERAISGVKTPQQAERIIDELERAHKGISEHEVAQQQPTPVDAEEAADSITQAALAPKKDRPQQVITEAAKQIAAAEMQDGQVLAEGVQKATNPESQAQAPQLTRERELLRAALLHRLKPLEAADTVAFLAVNSLPHTPALNALMYGLTTVMNRGDGWVLLLLAYVLRNRRMGWRAMVDVLPALWLATATVEGPIKQLFRRQRPFISIVRAIVVGRKPGNFSFPSGHSAAAFAGAALLRRHLPKRYWPALYGLAATVGFSRIYLGAHYPGDVFMGALSGTMLAELYRLALREVGEALD